MADVPKTPSKENLSAIRAGGKSALARALADLERSLNEPSSIALLDEAWRTPRAHVIGVTGPPGVGKSSLADVLIKHWRAGGRSVGAIVVDPSSKVSGGALLGDRTRIKTDPDDDMVFIRSMAARDRLGGLSSLTAAAAILMRSLFDIVLIETVGVGQSETDIEHTADTVVFCVQPGSGDALQFMKAGIMEVPHFIVVTKSDLGAQARRAVSDVSDAIGLVQQHRDEWAPKVLGVSNQDLSSISTLSDDLDARWRWLAQQERLTGIRERNDLAYLTHALRERFGREGVERLKNALQQAEIGKKSPFGLEQELAAKLKLQLL